MHTLMAHYNMDISYLNCQFHCTACLHENGYKYEENKIYTGVIKPTLMYGSVVWDSCNIECHQRLLKLQKRSARIILDADKRTPSIELSSMRMTVQA